MSPRKKASTVWRTFSMSRASSIRKKKSISKIKDKENDRKIPVRSSRRLHKWTSLICTSQANMSPKKQSASQHKHQNVKFPCLASVSCTNNVAANLNTCITVQNEASRRSMSIPFNSMTTPLDVCNEVAFQCDSDIDGVMYWSLYECIFDGNLERLVEDHEKIADICCLWDLLHTGYFIFRTDPHKHDPVTFPELAYSSAVMGDSKDTAQLSSKAQKAKLFLIREYLQNTQKFPDLHGQVYIRDGCSLTWKKCMCYIRGSGIYFSSIRHKKDPEHLKILSEFTGINVYHVKHQTRCPTSFCFAIKIHSQSGSKLEDLKYIATSSKEDYDKWIVALRLAQHGNCLQENYKVALHTKTRFQRLQGKI